MTSAISSTLRQYITQHMSDETMNSARLTKTDLMFGGMHIDINKMRRHVEINQIRRLATGKQHIVISLANRMCNHLVTHYAAVNIEILHISLTARDRRGTCPAIQAHVRRALVK